MSGSPAARRSRDHESAGSDTGEQSRSSVPCRPQILHPASRFGARYEIHPEQEGVGRRYWFHAATSSFLGLHGPPITARLHHACGTGCDVPCVSGGRKLVSAQTAGAVPGAVHEGEAADPATRVTLVLLSRFLDWRSMLTVVK